MFCLIEARSSVKNLIETGRVTSECFLSVDAFEYDSKDDLDVEEAEDLKVGVECFFSSVKN